jgi:glutamate 5-kinase
LSLKTITDTLISLNICPIFNENDVLSPAELDFSDNDQLAYMVAAMVGADQVMIFSNVDGVYDRSPSELGATIILCIDDITSVMHAVDDSAGSGKGGMRSKLQSAEIITSLGISMRIANGCEENVLYRIASGENIGTVFPAKNVTKTNIKKWLVTAAVGNGKIIVSTFLADNLRNRRASSILFVGVERVEGDFDKDDIVDICDESGAILGRGRVRYNADDLRAKVADYRQLSDSEKAKIATAETIAVHYNYFVFV